MRRFIQAHPKYEKNSEVTEKITHDLIEKMFIPKDRRKDFQTI